MTLYEFLKKTENIRVSLIRVCFRGDNLSKNISEQVSKSLVAQKIVGDYEEIGGSLFYINKNLEFKIIKLSEVLNLEKILTEIEQENYTNIDKVAAHLQESIEKRLNLGHPKNDLLDMLFFLYEMFTDPKEKNKLFENKELRLKIIDLYKSSVFGSSYNYNLNERGLYERGFSGLFHVHRSGTPPSIADINLNKEEPLPDLVISATADYLESGIKLYLVHSGSYEKLYEGPLQAKVDSKLSSSS